MAGIKISGLPSIPIAPALPDIFPEVQPASGGATYKTTFQQLLTLFQPGINLTNAGNPNGVLAGIAYEYCWDTTNNILYLCTTTGTSGTAVWTRIAGGTNFLWNNMTLSSITMIPNNGYIVNNNTNPAILTLPATVSIGSIFDVVGGTSASTTTSWKISQAAGQQIFFGASSTTVGTSGYLQATKQFDAVKLLCITANTNFVVLSSLGNITVN